MSAGNKVITFRLPADLIEEVRVALKSRNDYSCEEPWTWSDFVRHAIRAELDHRKRGKSPRRKKVESACPTALPDVPPEPSR